MEFLKAHWKHLLLANYKVDPELISSRVPDQTRLDIFEGKCFLSLVAFLFDNTRVLGIPVPFHRKFEEVNLRFYVVAEREPTRRAVTFVQEIVPKRVIPLIANTLFHENYVATRMSHRLQFDPNDQKQVNSVDYQWGQGLENRIAARIQRSLELPLTGSVSEFITEHYWGYANGPGGTLEYRVKHPKWVGCVIDDYDIEVDFERVYGPSFGFLKDLKPENVIYAQGSPVSVSFPSRLR